MDAGERVGDVPAQARSVIDLDALADEEAARLRPPHQCWVCSIQEREWVEKARREGRSIPVIQAVLIKQGHPQELATIYRIKTHLATCVK